MTIKISDLHNGKISVATPYNPEFVSTLKKKIGGARWDSENRCWTVPTSAIEGVREILRSVYGADDQQAGTEPTCKVRITTTWALTADRGPVVLFGKVIASATGRDSGARVGDGVVFVKGRCDSDGSFKNWKTWIESGSVIEVADVPVSLWDRYQAEARVEDVGYTAERIDGAVVDREALQAERARLLARLAEIDKLLA